MRIIFRLVFVVAAFVGLTGFSDSSGYYTLDIPPSWALYKRIEESTVVYCPNGDPRRGNLSIGRTAQPHGTTLHREAEVLAGRDPIVLQEKVVVAGRDCLHATYASNTNSGERSLTHVLVCDVIKTPYPGATGVFNFSVTGISGAYGIDYEAVFWSIVHSVKFTSP